MFFIIRYSYFSSALGDGTAIAFSPGGKGVRERSKNVSSDLVN